MLFMKSLPIKQFCIHGKYLAFKMKKDKKSKTMIPDYLMQFESCQKTR